MGHEDAFPRPRVSARCRFSQPTFAGTPGNGRDAPLAAIKNNQTECDPAALPHASADMPPIIRRRFSGA
jgi:hypothetical protein